MFARAWPPTEKLERERPELFAPTPRVRTRLLDSPEQLAARVAECLAGDCAAVWERGGALGDATVAHAVGETNADAALRRLLDRSRRHAAPESKLAGNDESPPLVFSLSVPHLHTTIKPQPAPRFPELCVAYGSSPKPWAADYFMARVDPTSGRLDLLVTEVEFLLWLPATRRTAPPRLEQHLWTFDQLEDRFYDWLKSENFSGAVARRWRWRDPGVRSTVDDEKTGAASTGIAASVAIAHRIDWSAHLDAGMEVCLAFEVSDHRSGAREMESGGDGRGFGGGGGGGDGDGDGDDRDGERVRGLLPWRRPIADVYVKKVQRNLYHVASLEYGDWRLPSRTATATAAGRKNQRSLRGVGGAAATDDTIAKKVPRRHRPRLEKRPDRPRNLVHGRAKNSRAQVLRADPQ